MNDLKFKVGGMNLVVDPLYVDFKKQTVLCNVFVGSLCGIVVDRGVVFECKMVNDNQDVLFNELIGVYYDCNVPAKYSEILLLKDKAYFTNNKNSKWVLSNIANRFLDIGFSAWVFDEEHYFWVKVRHCSILLKNRSESPKLHIVLIEDNRSYIPEDSMYAFSVLSKKHFDEYMRKDMYITKQVLKSIDLEHDIESIERLMYDPNSAQLARAMIEGGIRRVYF